MLHAVRRSLYPLALLAFSSVTCAASLVVINGSIYTANDAQPRAEAIIADEGRITFVGSTAEALRRAPKQAERIDLQGRALFPGFTDSHAHLSGIGERELSFNLEGTTSVADLQARLRRRAAEAKPGQWITGRGWIESRWTPAEFPTRTDLDAAVADHPVLLERADGHAVVANSAALKLAGIDRSTVDPAGGQILRDPKTHEPTGMIVDTAVDLVRRLVPPPTEADQMRALEVGAQRSVRLGWTQLHIAGNSFKEVDLIRRLCAQGKFKLRVYDAIGGPGPDADRLLASGASNDECGGRLTIRGIKLYIDGALGSRGAALLAPYSDAPDSQGLLVNREADLYPVLVSALRRGIQIETHAIGDRGNRIMLDLYEKAFRAVPAAQRAVAEPRWRIEHAQILDSGDIPRFGRLGVIASMQPSHAISDLFFAPSRLGPQRLSGAYAWRSLIDSGAIVVGGSDAPVERGEPLIEFYAAVVRRSLEGFADENWHREEQRLSREQALKMFTLGPAYAAFQEKDKGSIEVGKRADFTVFATDIMQIPETEILKSRAVMTVIGGEVVAQGSD
jgi:predicted amidohydrolase YtcJ